MIRARVMIMSASAILWAEGRAGGDDGASSATSASTGESTGASTSDTTTGETTDAETETGEPPGLVCDGFEFDAVDWWLPGVIVLEEVLDDFAHDSSAGCLNSGEEFSFSLLDLVGDPRPDLVVTDNCDPAGVGTSLWLVHEALGSGFAARATPWTLPNIVATQEVLDDLGHDSSAGCLNAEELSFTLLDLVGDRRPDLVVTDNCDPAGVGTSEWQIYEATSAGFAAQAISWSLPNLVAAQEVLDDLSFDSSTGCLNGEELTFSLLDLVGDRRPDLVVTDNCDVAGVGTSAWQVYEATDTGFAAEATSWSLPNLVATEEVLDDPYHDSSAGCLNGEELTFTLLDLVGDRRPDLVVTDYCDAAGVGTSEWRVYEATGAGFAAEATSWTLPNIVATEEVLDDLFHDSSAGCLNTETLTFSVLDLTGDRVPDLVLTDNCDAAGVGTSEWQVYTGTAAGFAAQPVSWSLPNIVGLEEVLDDLSHDSSAGCFDSQTLTFSLADLTGDGASDMVWTDACDVAGVGTTLWRLFPRRCVPR
ncbi:MAG: hypothetical protein R3B09_23905 [Nannocystaceae bacterium]